jgi:hypothetical protein
MRAVILAILSMTAFLAQASVTITPMVSQNSNGSVNVNVRITDSDSAGTRQFFVGALYAGSWYFLQLRAWLPWQSGKLQDIPSYHSTSVLLTDAQINALSDTDLSIYPGLRIYAGMGVSADDMIQQGSYGLVLDAALLPQVQPGCSTNCIAFSSTLSFQMSTIAGQNTTLPQAVVTGALVGGATLTMSDSTGCKYSGTLRPMLAGIPDLYTGSVTSSGCQDSVRNGRYSSFTLAKDSSGRYSITMVLSALTNSGYIVTGGTQ